MNNIISQIPWHGWEAWALESVLLRTVVVPALGAKIVSLFDKRSQLEWLAGPGERPLNQVPYGAVFTDQDMSGWDEMFPTILACEYPQPGAYAGAALPDHGEVWALPWDLEAGQPEALTMSVRGRALPYRLTREMRFCAADTLQMRYRVENLSQEVMPYIWAAHPQLLSGDEAEICLPDQVREVCNTIGVEWGWGESETRFAWPSAISPGQQRRRIDQMGPATLRKARKFYVPPEVRAEWAGLIRRPGGDWLRLEWDAQEVPYLGIWMDEGAISPTSVVALEPTTGYFDSLALAWKKKEVARLEPGEVRSWTLNLRLGLGEIR